MNTKCSTCKYREFYERNKELSDYIEKEALRRIENLLKEGKLRPKSNINRKPTEKVENKTLDQIITEIYDEAKKQVENEL